MYLIGIGLSIHFFRFVTKELQQFSNGSVFAPFQMMINEAEQAVAGLIVVKAVVVKVDPFAHYFANSLCGQFVSSFGIVLAFLYLHPCNLRIRRMLCNERFQSDFVSKPI